MWIVHWSLFLRLPWRTGFAPLRARYGVGTAAWIAGVLETPGTQESWWLGSRKFNALEGYGNQYWPIRFSILAWRTPLPDREAWQATVYRVSESWTLPKWTCTHRLKTFFACGSSAPVRGECEGNAAAWLAGTLAAPSLQGHGHPLPQELRPYQSLFWASCSWWSEGLFGQSFSVAPPIQALRGLPCLGSFSVVPRVSHLKRHPGWGPTL